MSDQNVEQEGVIGDPPMEQALNLSNPDDIVWLDDDANGKLEVDEDDETDG